MTLAFAPWIIFAVVVNSPSTWEWGALGALVAALYAAVPKSRGSQVKLMDAATVVFFGVLCVIGLFVSADDLEWLERYAQVISSFALAALMLASLAFVPFTEQYAREHVPREYWGSPKFKRANRLLTTVWGGALLLAGVSSLIAVDAHGTTYDVFTWIVPIVLIVGAIKFTAYYTGEENGDDRERSRGRPGGRGRRPDEAGGRVSRS
jgi:hypothetical protein